MRLFFQFVAVLALFALVAVAPAIAAGDPEQSYIALQWDHANLREDGAALTLDEIAGYRIYSTYENEPTQVTNLTPVTSHTFVEVAPGTYAFTISTVDTDGREGAQSPAINVTVADNATPAPPAPAPITRVIIERCDSAGVCSQEVVR